MPLKVACIQSNSGSDVAANIAALKPLVERAAQTNATLVALPENTFRMEAPGERGPYPSEENHEGVTAASRWAQAFGIWLLVGSAAVLPTPDASLPVNRSLLFNPQGEVAARYDKLHLFDVTLSSGERYAESAKFTRGEKPTLAVTPFGGLGMTICYDVRFPALYRTLAKAGAAILAVPSAFTHATGSAHWHVLLRARAIENGCFVIAPAQAGMHPGGRRTFGHSLIVNPWGEVLAEGSESEPGVIAAELDLSEVERARGQIPSLKHGDNMTYKM